MNTHKESIFKAILVNPQVRSTVLMWVIVAGVCAVLANVIAASVV